MISKVTDCLFSKKFLSPRSSRSRVTVLHHFYETLVHAAIVESRRITSNELPNLHKCCYVYFDLKNLPITQVMQHMSFFSLSWATVTLISKVIMIDSTLNTNADNLLKLHNLLHFLKNRSFLIQMMRIGCYSVLVM